MCERRESAKKALNYVATMLLCELLLLLTLLLLLPLCCCCCQVRRDKWKCLCVHCSHCSDKYLHNSSHTAPSAFSPSLSFHAPLYLSLCCSSPCLPCCSCSVHIPCKPLCILPSFYLVCSLSPCLFPSSLPPLSSPCLSLPMLLIPCLLFAPINQRRLALYQVYSPHSYNLLLL